MATLRVMVADLDTIRPRVCRNVELAEDRLEMLLFDFLQEIIFFKDAEGLLLIPKEVSISGAYQPESALVGEALDPSHHELLVDVKAVTMHRFRLSRDAKGVSQGWEMEAVLDI